MHDHEFLQLTSATILAQARFNFNCGRHVLMLRYKVLEFHGRLTPALNSSCSPPKIYSGREFSPHGFQWAEYLEMMIEVVGHPLALTDGNLYLILAL